MCGIAGIFAVDSKPPTEREVRKMTDALSHRGPDGDGLFVEGPIALGHRRLSIIDLDTGHQPMISSTGRSIISFNGEIYNYRELREKLLGDGFPLNTKSDTEVVIGLYEQHGLDFLDYLSGMFAFALWDRREQKLILARDRIGIKPLYFHNSEGRVYFASEIKSIRKAVPGLNQLDPEAVNSYFTRQYVGGEGTMFKGVKKLLPARAVEITAGRQTEKHYWQPEPAIQNGTSEERTVGKLCDLMDLAVKRHLVSDVPVGVFLSGGLDSSYLVALAARSDSDALNTFSVGFGRDHRFNETRQARMLAERYKTRHHEIQVTGSDALEHLPFLIEKLDEPLADYAILPTYVMSRFAAETVKVVLSGEGADELFGGYKRYHAYSLYDRLGRYSRNDWLGNQLPGSPVFKESERRRALNGAFLEDRRLAAEAKMLADRAYFQRAGQLNSLLYSELKNWLVDDLLLKVDKMGMLASLEARVPYLDQQVVEFVLGLSGKLKVGLRSKKRILKAAAESCIPQAILRRPKHGFTVPVGEWLRGPLRRRFEEVVFDSNRTTEWLDKDFVAKLMRQHMHGKDLGLKLWSILIFCWWAEHHLD